MKAAKYIVLGVLLLTAMSLLALGPRDDESAPDGRVVVEYWEKWTGNEGQQMRQIVDSFNDTVGSEKGIYVRYMSTSAINQKTLVAAAAGLPPDIAGLFDANVVPYAAQDALEPLDEMAAKAGITGDSYKRVYWDACHYKGHLYALVSTPGAVALLYNRLAFEAAAPELRAAGLDPTRAPQTLAELDQYAAVLTRKNANGRVDRAGYVPLEPGWYVPYTWMWFGGEVFNERTGKFTLTDPKVVAAYDWIASYSRRMGASATNEFRGGLGNFDSPQNGFFTGYVVMEQQGPWMANFFEHQAPAMQHVLWSRDVEMTKPLAERRKNYAWAAAPFPSAVPGMKDVTLAAFDALVIPRAAKHKREAFEFITYVNRQDVMERICTMHCKNSPLRNVSESFLRNHPNPYIDVFEKLASSPNARSVPQIPIWQEVSDELTALGQQMTLLQGDAQSSLASIQDRMQASYDKFVANQQALANTKAK